MLVWTASYSLKHWSGNSRQSVTWSLSSSRANSVCRVQRVALKSSSIACRYHTHTHSDWKKCDLFQSLSPTNLDSISTKFEDEVKNPKLFILWPLFCKSGQILQKLYLRDLFKFFVFITIWFVTNTWEHIRERWRRRRDRKPFWERNCRRV